MFQHTENSRCNESLESQGIEICTVIRPKLKPNRKYIPIRSIKKNIRILLIVNGIFQNVV